MNIDTPETDPLVMDTNRIFYYEGGHFKQNWVDVQVDLEGKQFVEVIWDGGHKRRIYGQDAVQFLKITKSRYAGVFQDANPKRQIS